MAQILSNSEQKSQLGRFFSEMTIRSDRIVQHIAQLSLIPGNEKLSTINLER